MQSLFIVNTISIHANALQVWDALVNPQKTKIYMFGCETVSDWEIGSELLWKGNYNGVEMVFVKGHIIAFEPSVKLVYTVFDPNSTLADIPENYLTVTYELSQKGNLTELNVTQGDYSKVAEGERRYKESYNNGEGWNPILIQIKNVSESN